MATLDRGAALFDPHSQRDYNHATDSTYQDLRSKAQQLYDRRTRLSQELQAAYRSGNKQRAHELSEQLKQVLAEAELWNRRAAEYVFLENNADLASDEIDLHGLYVKEAEWVLQKRIAEAQRRHQRQLRVIVGKGLHLQNGVAKLKPAVDGMCREAGLSHHLDPKNSGVLVIDLLSAGSLPSSWDTLPFQPQGQGQTYQQPAHQQQPYYQQQPAHNQYQQQPYQNQQSGGLLGTLLTLVCNCLK